MPTYFLTAEAAGETARMWIGAGAVACLVLVIFAVVAGEKIRSWIGACAHPQIDAHDRDADAHAAALRSMRDGMAQLEKAVAILNGCVQSQQGQIVAVDNARKETLQLVMQQVQQAVDLLGRE